MKFPNDLLKPILNMELDTCPARLGSVMLWRDVFSGRIEEYKSLAVAFKANGFTYPGGTYESYMDAVDAIYHKDFCPFCDTAGTRVDEEDRYYYCICWLLRQEDKLKKISGEYGSAWKPQSLDDFKTIHMPPVVRQKYEEKIAYLKNKWILHPDKWLVLYGGTGTGKTHTLNAIMKDWFPWALYIVASDFEEKLRSYMAEDQNEIQRFVDALKTHPMLVIDDLGIQYSTEWIASKLDAVIEYRSREARWWDSITVFATNIHVKDFRSSMMRNDVSRTGSRLLNNDMVKKFAYNVEEDYRERSRK